MNNIYNKKEAKDEVINKIINIYLEAKIIFFHFFCGKKDNKMVI